MTTINKFWNDDHGKIKLDSALSSTLLNVTSLSQSTSVGAGSNPAADMHGEEKKRLSFCNHTMILKIWPHTISRQLNACLARDKREDTSLYHQGNVIVLLELPNQQTVSFEGAGITFTVACVEKGPLRPLLNFLLHLHLFGRKRAKTPNYFVTKKSFVKSPACFCVTANYERDPNNLKHTECVRSRTTVRDNSESSEEAFLAVDVVAMVLLVVVLVVPPVSAPAHSGRYRAAVVKSGYHGSRGVDGDRNGELKEGQGSWLREETVTLSNVSVFYVTLHKCCAVAMKGSADGIKTVAQPNNGAQPTSKY
ncbi:unnamed protein product [Enterobius vermicularis]|uniref:ZP domain-containing protein n=1 Tax=Enterobius vermicularis TaxID=51028 RepID=A0A0N4UZV0_ENTVE|nr:unnamed protein product [Enterobius vermicularis]